MKRHVNRVLDELSPEQLHDYEQACGGHVELVKAMCKRATALLDYLAGPDERIASDHLVLMAAATLKIRNNGTGVHPETRHAAARFDQLLARRRALPRLPLDLLISARDEPAHVLARAEATKRVMDLLDEDLPLDQLHTTMVAATVADPDTEPAHTAAIVDGMVQWAVAGIRQYVAADPNVLKHRLPVPGNLWLFLNIAAARMAVEHTTTHGITPTGPLDPDTLITRLAELTKQAKNYYNASRKWRGEPDGAPLVFAYAQFLGGSVDGKNTKQIFQVLHPKHGRLQTRPRWETPTGTVDEAGGDMSRRREAITADVTAAGDVEPGVLASMVDGLVSLAMAELYVGASEDEIVYLRQWLTDPAGVRLTGKNILALVNRLRALDARFRSLSRKSIPPDVDLPDDPVVAEALTKRFSELVHTERSAPELLAAVLPPLWTGWRGPVINAIVAKLRVELGRQVVPAHVYLLAATLARAPLQWCHSGSSANVRPCACGARVHHGRPSREADTTAVCPHRTWQQPGPVEDYATLGQLSTNVLGSPMTPDAIRKAIARYEGPFAEWVRDAFAASARAEASRSTSTPSSG